nr:MAG TPA: hypothetical protein [Caudoviricetes sp.]
MILFSFNDSTSPLKNILINSSSPPLKLFIKRYD